MLYDATHTAGGAAVVLTNVADDDLVADERPLQSTAVDENVVAAVIGARKAEILRERNERRFHVFADRNKLRVVLAVKQNHAAVF